MLSELVKILKFPPFFTNVLWFWTFWNFFLTFQSAATVYRMVISMVLYCHLVRRSDHFHWYLRTKVHNLPWLPLFLSSLFLQSVSSFWCESSSSSFSSVECPLLLLFLVFVLVSFLFLSLYLELSTLGVFGPPLLPTCYCCFQSR